MGKLVKHGSQGVADGTVAKDSFDMPETLPQIENLELAKNTSLYDKEATGKNILPEVNDAVEDVPADKDWVEVSQGTIAPQQAGKPEYPLEDADMARFANQGTPDYVGKKDNLDDGESLKKPLGHLTK